MLVARALSGREIPCRKYVGFHETDYQNLVAVELDAVRGRRLFLATWEKICVERECSGTNQQRPFAGAEHQYFRPVRQTIAHRANAKSLLVTLAAGYAKRVGSRPLSRKSAAEEHSQTARSINAKLNGDPVEKR